MGRKKKKELKLVVLDYSCNAIFIFPYDNKKWSCPEDVVDEQGHPIITSNCHWMVVEDLHISFWGRI